MAKLTLDDTASGYNATAKINANNDLIEAAIENTISRDGTSPNTMSADLDMNTQGVTNLREPNNAQDAATKAYADSLLSGTTDSGSATLRADIADTSASKGAQQVGYDSTGDTYVGSSTVDGALGELSDSSNIAYDQGDTGSVERTIEARLQDRVSIFDFMTTAQITDVKERNKTLDLTSVFTAAFATGLPVYLPDGAYRLDSAPTLTAYTSLSGNNTYADPTRCIINCYNITGYLFDITIKKALAIDGVGFDGSQNEWDQNTRSSTWSGVVYNSAPTTASAYTRALTLRHVQAGYSNSPTFVIDLANIFNVRINECKLTSMPYGGAIKSGQAGAVTTTIVVNKTYMNQNRHCVDIGTNVSDVHFSNCIFESSVVAISLYITTALFTACYFENIGYDLSATGITTGLIDKDFGIAYGAGNLDTGVVSAINIAYASVEFLSCRISYLNTAHKASNPEAAWLFLMGRGSATGTGGSATFRSCSATGYNTAGQFNEVEDYALSYAASFNWYAGDRETFLPYVDCRRIERGFVAVEFGTTGLPGYAERLDVKRGKFIIDSSYTTPTGSPLEGAWEVGDILYDPAPTASGFIGKVCTSNGTFSSASDVTGDTDGSTAVITGMADTSDFFVGQYVTASAGFASTTVPYEILSLTSTTMTLNVNSNSTQSNITVVTVDAVFKTFGAISA